MTGRRILDAAAIFKAARGVASKHAALRKHQLDVYSKTSTLAKAVQSQTDRVTLTVKAASALAERFNGPGAEYSTRASGADTFVERSPKPKKPTSESERTNSQQQEGLEQDQFYQKPEDNTTKEAVPQEGLEVKQTKSETRPLPDGSELPAEPVDSRGTLDAHEAKKSQRQAERQIPSQAAEPPPAAASDPATARNIGVSQSSSVKNQEQDVFYTQTTSSGQVLSALPRAKIPKNTEDVQASNEQVADEGINQDVFYSSEPEGQKQAVPESQAVPEQEQIPDEAYSEIFHSPRVARMLSGGRKKGNVSDGLELAGARKTPVQQMKPSTERDHVNSSARVPGLEKAGEPGSVDNAATSGASEGKGPEHVHELANDVAKDATNVSADTSDLPKDIEVGTTKAPYEMRESPVPSSRFGRIWQYGGLAASMTFGAVGESFRRATGSGSSAGGSLMLSAGNMERLVAKLSRMRGAALKLGQMMSFQDSKMLPGPINEVLQRVQDSADYMPPSQRDKVLASNLGADWRDLFASFDEKPIAAASIGQVHSATLKSSGKRVAVKVQYPGVANSIDSDLSNISLLLTASRLLPKGLYLDKTIANARIELGWECDYVREAEMGERFRQLLADETDTFHVPAIIKEASGPQVLTAEFCEGIGVTKVQNFTQAQKDWIGTNILRLCLREITEFKFMQTDPNWTNFLFNAKTNKLELLDFGASRDFPDKFIDPYIRVLQAASRLDRKTIRDLSIQLGYLTGNESQAMLNAHVNSVLTLAEPFMETAPEVYDFRDQTITDRVRGFIPVMVRERLAPPPEETYSMHRKLSGAFLLCARLGSRVSCREMFRTAMGGPGIQ